MSGGCALLEPRVIPTGSAKVHVLLVALQGLRGLPSLLGLLPGPTTPQIPWLPPWASVKGSPVTRQ